MLTGAYALATMVGWRDLQVPAAHWVAHLLALGVVLALAAIAQRWVTWLTDALVAAVWALWCNATTAPLSYALMRARVPLDDDRLAAFDRALGLPVPQVRVWLDVLPQDTWWRLYDLLIPLLAVAVVVLPLTRRVARTRTLLAAYCLSFALAIPIMASVQALGPWAVHGYAPVEAQLGYVRELTALKATGPFEFDTTRTTGVVTFPSFHALLATLGGWALAPVRGVGPVAVGVSAAIVLGTVATGWHYVADVVAGMALAALAIRLAGAGERLWAGEERSM